MSKSKGRKSKTKSIPDLPTPKAQTMWRLAEVSGQLDSMLQDLARYGLDALALRSPEALAAIQAAQTPAQLVFLTKDARGMAVQAWRERMQAFGAEALPSVVRRLQSSQSIRDEDEREVIVERLIGVMPRLGDGAGAALLSCFNSLDTYGQSLACIVFGVMGLREAGDVIWRYFEHMRDDEDMGFIVGALWGLLDLDDARADEGMAYLLTAERWFPEQYGFAARGGSLLCLGPLIERMFATIRASNYENEGQDVIMALAGMMTRVGEAPVRAALTDAFNKPEDVERLVAALHDRRPHLTRHFEIYFPPAQAE